MPNARAVMLLALLAGLLLWALVGTDHSPSNDGPSPTRATHGTVTQTR